MLTALTPWLLAWLAFWLTLGLCSLIARCLFQRLGLRRRLRQNRERLIAYCLSPHPQEPIPKWLQSSVTSSPTTPKRQR